MALGGASCALLLAVLVGVCALHVGAFERARVQPSNTLRAQAHDAHERWVGVHEPFASGQWELPRPTGKPSPATPRFAPRSALASPLEASLIARSRPLGSRRAPEGQGRIADRPVVANCPAQGPPRTA